MVVVAVAVVVVVVVVVVAPVAASRTTRGNAVLNNSRNLTLTTSAPSDDPDNSNLHGFEVTIPTQNIDWSDPGGDLRIKLAPDYSRSAASSMPARRRTACSTANRSR